MKQLTDRRSLRAIALPKYSTLLMLCFWAIDPLVGRSQVVPDGSLGTENSQVIPESATTTKIKGGATRGNILFHSFRDFNIYRGQNVYFVNPARIHTIFSRVTGGNPSVIDGRLGLEGNIDGNLFFINPKGILFGSGARLDLNGSFIATTAEAISFPDGTKFSATSPEVAPLLTIETPNPIGLEFAETFPGAIINRSRFTFVPRVNSLTFVAGTIANLTESTRVLRNDLNLVTVPSNNISLVLLNEQGGFLERKTQVSNNILDSSANPSLAKLIKATRGIRSLSVSPTNQVILRNSGLPIEPGDILLSNYEFRGERGRRITLNSARDAKIINSVIETNNSNAGIFNSFSRKVEIFAERDIFISNSFVSSNADGLSSVNGSSISLTSGGDVSLDRGSIISTSTFFQSSANAGNIQIDGNNVNLYGGSQITSSLTSETSGNAGNIEINSNNINLYEGSQITNVASEDSSGDAGDINLNATQNILLENNENSDSSTIIEAESLGAGSTGNITLTSQGLSLQNGSKIAISSNGLNNIGNLQVDVAGTVEISGSSDIGDISSLQVETNITSDRDILAPEPGNVKVDAGNLILKEGGQISTILFNSSPTLVSSGNIDIQADEINLSEDAKITSDVFINGQAGYIRINGAKYVNIDSSKITTNTTEETQGIPGEITIAAPVFNLVNNSEISASAKTGSFSERANQITIYDAQSVNISNSKIATDVATGATAKGGDIQIISDNLKLSDRATITTSSNGTPDSDAGNIYLQAGEMHLTGNSSVEATTSAGRGGTITAIGKVFTADTGSRVTTTTTGNKIAGDIKFEISDRLSLTNTNTGLFANTEPGSSGDGGNIFIDPKTFVIADNAGVFVNSLGTGKGGSITIFAENLLLDSGSISAEAAGSLGGNINLNSQLLRLRNRSQISTTAGKISGTGDGGNIFIDTNFLIARTEENSDITANAFLGNGGNISIFADSIFGIQPRNNLTPFSDITASSELGLVGDVQINIDAIDPTKALEKLPEILVNTQINTGCQALNSGSRIGFYNMGRSGLTRNPDELLSGELSDNWTPWKQDRAVDIPNRAEHNNGGDLSAVSQLSLPCEPK